MADLGNAWHIPGHPEPPGRVAMRDPVGGIFAQTAVTVVSGNQFRGPGNPGNQLQSGSTLVLRRATDASWTALPLTFERAAGNNKYFAVTIPGGSFENGDRVQYYLRIAYDDHPTTFVHAQGHASTCTADESVARASPFTYPVGPSGDALTHDLGSVQARLFKETGHIEIAGPDLAGAAHAVTVTCAVLAAQESGQSGILGRVISSMAVPDGWEVEQDLDGTPVRARLTFPHEAVMRYEVVDWGGQAPASTTIAVRTDPNEHFYGFGEKFNAFDQAGKVVHILPFDQAGDKGDRSYKAVPWVASTRGYGFHLDSSADSRFDLGDTARYTVTQDGQSLALQLVYGPRLPDVLSRYTGLTGRPRLPPPWAFGPWISSDVWRNGGEARYAVTGFRRRNIPAAAFVFDSPWAVAYNDYTFNAKQFGQGKTFTGDDGVEHDGFDLADGHIADLMTFLQQAGLKVICWMTPFINTSSTTADRDDHGIEGQNLGQSSNYAVGAANGFFVRESVGGPPLKVRWWKGQGSPVDFTNPAARQWLTGQLQSLLASSRVTTRDGSTEAAIGGFKTDDGETGSSDGNVYIPESAAYADGRTVKEMRNGYCVDYHRTVYGAVRESLGDDGLIFARSGFTGTHAFPGYWAGDNEPNFGTANGLPSVIIAGLSAAMSGYSIWGHDVGGYQNHRFSPISRANLFMRWAQFGCFSPIMQMHRQVKRSTGDPEGTRFGQYPWGYGADAEENFRFYAGLHTRLFPYIYTYAQAASETGLPIIRPLVLMHQDDPNTYAIADSYLFGDDVLVAPIIRPTADGMATERTVYLPSGAWRDFWTHERHQGGQAVTYRSANQRQFPLFVREGAIVPMLLAEVDTLCGANYVNNPEIRTPDDGLWLLMYPADVSAFTLYDGTSVRCERSGSQRTVTLSSGPRRLILKLMVSEPATVTRDGVNLERFAAPPGLDTSNGSWALPAQLQAGSPGWTYVPTPGWLLIGFTHGGGMTRITF
jgi:alpha-D-xyloside xylohydrolase